MKVLGCVGAGSFGKVFRVEVGGEIFALKRIELEFDCGDDCWELKQARKEAKILQECLYHPNIVRYYASYRQGDHYYIAMEYVRGSPISDLQLPFKSQAMIVAFVIQILFALKFLKRNSILHRDLKPSNILISEKGLFKVVDFGISKKLIESNLAVSCLGTPYYTAPEILAEEKYDYRVDIWSFGVILYEICHGQVPFLARSMGDLKKKIKEVHPPLRNDLHDDLKLIIRGCLAKDPTKRFTIQQMLNLPLIHQQIVKEVTSKPEKRQYYN